MTEPKSKLVQSRLMLHVSLVIPLRDCTEAEANSPSSVDDDEIVELSGKVAMQLQELGAEQVKFHGVSGEIDHQYEYDEGAGDE